MTNTFEKEISRTVRARVATLAAISVIYPAAALGAALCATTMFAAPAHAAEASIPAPAPVAFQKKSFELAGDIRVEQRGDRTVLVFSDDFRTKRGPDLKVFLSPRSVSDATGRNATTGAVRLGELVSNRGGQEYVLPEGVDIADYGSVLVHCEAFSKLWGGADI
ncbi:MAG: DM13 domain-containing protein [Litorimonas sp.]